MLLYNVSKWYFLYNYSQQSTTSHPNGGFKPLDISHLALNKLPYIRWVVCKSELYINSRLELEIIIPNFFTAATNL